MEQICRVAFDEIRAVHPERIFRLETSGELEGRFDAERLQQVLSNLLNNAVQHGARDQPITLSARGETDKVTVQVKNYGRAIPADQLQVIFNPLVQIPPSPPATTMTAAGHQPRARALHRPRDRDHARRHDRWRSPRRSTARYSARACRAARAAARA